MEFRNSLVKKIVNFIRISLTMTFLLVGISDGEAFTAAIIGVFCFFIQDMQLLEGHCPPWHP